MNLRRPLALGAAGLAAMAALSACGFDYPTDRINNITAGVDYRDGTVDILNAAVVAKQANSGTFVATFVNGSPTKAISLQSASGDNTAITHVDATPFTLQPSTLLNLAGDRRHPGAAGRSPSGSSCTISFQFDDGETANLSVPVVADDGQWAGSTPPRRPPTRSSSASPSLFELTMTYTLVLLRHGESIWNAENLFTGWVDVDLSDKGRAEAQRGGEQLRDAGILPDVVHTSLLRRAITTAAIGLDVADRHWIPVRRSWRLNERHYGALQGKNKKQTLEEYGEEQFMLWRRSFDVPPPPIDDDDEFSQAHDVAVRRPRRRAAPHRVPQGRHRPAAALLGRPARRRPARRARPCWSPRTATACGRSSSTSTASATTTSPGSTSPPGCRWSTSSTTTCGPTVKGGRYLDPDAAAEAAAAVANQGR